MYILGSLLNWRIVAGLSLLLPVTSTLSFFFLPESPVWMVRKGYPEAAKRALVWLRGGNIGQVSLLSFPPTEEFAPTSPIIVLT